MRTEASEHLGQAGLMGQMWEAALLLSPDVSLQSLHGSKFFPHAWMKTQAVPLVFCLPLGDKNS